ncbi:MAG: BrnT family toxin [Bdellovibrionales bacterium]
MKYEWDEAKNARNRDVHGVDFDLVESFEWSRALIAKDERWDYGEIRLIGYGFIGKRLYICVYTQRPHARRIISLRKANKREEKLYEEAIKTFDE